MKSAPILIIDKIGLIGEPLSFKLSKEFTVVFVSKKSSAHVPFSKKFPVIPDDKYSHIIVIVEENEALEFLPRVIEKAKGVNSDLIFAKDLFSKDNYVEKIMTGYPSSKIVLYGDIFDEKLMLRGENLRSAINKFLYQAQKFGRIQILGNGLKESYPVSINDVVDGLIDLIFGINDLHSLFYIFPKHPPSELSLAHMIQKANPHILIDFIEHEERKEVFSFPPHGKYLLDVKYPLAKKIRSIDIQKMVETQDKANSQEVYNKRGNPFYSFIVWILIFLIFSPFVFTLLFSFFGLNALYFAKKQIDRGDFANVKSYLHFSNTSFSIGKKASDILLFQVKIIGREQNLKRLLEDIGLGHKISQGLLQAFNAESYLTKVITGKSNNPIEDFTKGQSDLKGSIVTFEKLQAEEKIPTKFSQKLNSIDPLIKLVSDALDVLPNIFGLDRQKTYLVLFQNNMELRPGGGFISSYGILKLNMGKIVDFSIHDVYDADRQLRGHIEPPFALRRHLASIHWYLKDSNFDVDFVKSASSSSNFLYVETGQKVDGVIGIDVSFVKNILHAIGPVYVADYKAMVDENNLYMLTQSHAEKNFLISIYKAIQIKISQGSISYLSVIQAVSDSISQKHLVFVFNSNLQNIFTVNGWSSTLWDERKEDKNSINDFFGINEANLGINKVNYFIKRKISQKAKIGEDGTVFSELTINYKNASTSWSGGEYKNYLRIILPKDTEISEISINDIPQVLVDAVTDFQIYEAKGFKPPIGLEVEKVNQDNKTIYGFLVKVPVGELVKIKIQYNVARNSAFDLNNFSYSLKFFKQPGVDVVPYSFFLYYPDHLNVIKASNGLKNIDGRLSYSESIVGDKEVLVDFARK